MARASPGLGSRPAATGENGPKSRRAMSAALVPRQAIAGRLQYGRITGVVKGAFYGSSYRAAHRKGHAVDNHAALL